MESAHETVDRSPWQAQPTEQDQRTHGLLERIIENDVLPRLLLAKKCEPMLASTASVRGARELAEHVLEFAELVLKNDKKQLMDYFEVLRKQGESIESLFHDLIAPTARRLGVFWDEDTADFMDVAQGIGHLQQVVRAYGRESCNEANRPPSNLRVLLLPVPGEGHTFGLSLLREGFLREGWDVWCDQWIEFDDVVEMVRAHRIELIGLSASILKNPAMLALDIRRIREATSNPRLRIFVGGHAFNSRPDLVAAVGADATACDAREAVSQAMRMTAHLIHANG